MHRGARSLTDAELLSILLRTNNGTAGQLLEKIGGLHQLAGIDSHALTGISKARSTTLLATAELACRIARAEIPEKIHLSRPGTVARYLKLRYERSDQEVMGALYLDVRNRLVHETELFRGTLSKATVEPRAILRKGLACNAARIILFHTHPSGDPAPSAEDIGFTKRLVKACHVVGIGLRDHIIIGANQWVSLRQMGEL